MGGCGIREYTHIEMFKRKLSCARDKRLWFIINTMLFKTFIPVRI